MSLSSAQAISDETIALTKNAYLEKAGITTGLNLQGYNLEAPSKKLYPALSPLRNMIARTKAAGGSIAAHWKAITGINTLNLEGSVAFGQRNASSITYNEIEASSTYKSWGMDDTIDQEAVWLSRNFENVRALSTLAAMQSAMVEEEKLILGGVGSSTNALGTPVTPSSLRVATATGFVGTWTGTDNAGVKVMALPLYGYLNSDKAGLTSVARHSIQSAAKTQALTAVTDSVVFSTTAINGAFAWAWFVGEAAGTPADSALLLYAITTVPNVRVTGPGTGIALSAVTGQGTDTSFNANAFDGIFPQVIPAANGFTTLDNSLASGTLKQCTTNANPPNSILFDMLVTNTVATVGGTQLTADGAGGIKELDLVLKYMWDIQRIGPTLILMNSQEALSITRLIGGNVNGATLKFPVAPGDKGLTGGIFYSGYLNKFTGTLTPGSPDVIPFMIHPYMPPGTILFLSERLPYPNNQVPNVLEMEMQQEYADYEWAMTTRQYQHGVYANGTLKHYFPGGCAVIRGIAPS